MVSVILAESTGRIETKDMNVPYLETHSAMALAIELEEESQLLSLNSTRNF